MLIPIVLLFTLAASQTHHILNSPFAHSTITECLPAGRSTITLPITCHDSCTFQIRRELRTALSVSTTFQLQHLHSNRILHSFHIPAQRFPAVHETPVRHLPPAKYRLTLRAHNQHAEPACGLLTYAVQRQFEACQLVLPTVLRPTPSPSVTPSPSRTPTSNTSTSNTTNREEIIPVNEKSDPQPSPQTSESDNQVSAARQVTPRIVGGSIPDPSLWTHMVAFIANGAFVCSGSVISARWAITAAHCRISAGMRASVGGDTVTSGTLMNIQAAFPHPDFDLRETDSPNDISLILFSEEVPEGTKFIRINTNETVPEPGAYSRVAGYGQTFQKQSSALRQVDLPVVSTSKCKSDYNRANPRLAARLDGSRQLCAGLSQGGCDACQGDSGGPLALFDSSGHIIQIGVVSFGIGCARAGFPGVYTRISFFEPWMREVGAGYTRSTDGVTVFSTGSAEAAGDGSGGFSIAGLSTLQTILLIGGAALVAVILIFLGLTGLAGRRRRRRRASAPPPPPPLPLPLQSPPPLDNGQYGSPDGSWHAQGLYPVQGVEHQYVGYQPQPSYPLPVARDLPNDNEIAQGATTADAEPIHAPSPNVEVPEESNPPGTSSYYPQNTVLHR